MTSASGPCPGIPTGAAAISLNVTVVNTAGPGFIMAYPEGGAAPTVSTLNYNAGQVLANAAIVPMSATGGITVVAGVSGTDLILDVNGYFIGGGTSLNSGEGLSLSGSSTAVLTVENTRESDYGVAGLFRIRSTLDAMSAVHGIAGATSGITYGLYGSTFSSTAGASGVKGFAQHTSGEVYGVRGRSGSITTGTAGVLGEAGYPGYPNDVSAGVVGVLGTTTGGYGVFGKATTGIGIRGAKVDATTGVPTASGVLGYLTSYGVYSYNDLGATGTKSFVEPHPTDASRQIVYVAMEGPEAGTYFRGRGRFEGKKAVIVVPEDFRLVTEEEGLTVQITPMGGMTLFGVVSADLNQVVVESARDVEFSYLVQGVRKNYKGHEPIQKNTLFVPMGFDARMEPYPAHIQKRLVDLGIYNADGTVNVATAERMGWAQTWREEAAALQAAAAARAAEDRATGPGGIPRR
ncbi:MAG: hypothetical protein IPN83_08275 [Holophagales bacterium]|nr:hypothetical protein [Holophagales bacterium]